MGIWLCPDSECMGHNPPLFPTSRSLENDFPGKLYNQNTEFPSTSTSQSPSSQHSSSSPKFLLLSTFPEKRRKLKTSNLSSSIMPSPSPIPRSSSYPIISKTHSSSHPHSHSRSYVPPPSKHSPSPGSADSQRSAWLSKKVENYIARKSNNTSASKRSDLTKETLEEFNRRNEIFLYDKKKLNTAAYSPYYKGLTDSSLAINRHGPLVSSPDRESNRESNSSSSSKPSFKVKLQEWTSWFSIFREEEKSMEVPVARRKPSSQHAGAASYSSSSSSSLRTNIAATTTIAKELGLETKDQRRVALTGNSNDSISDQEPLRERDSEPPPPQPPVSAPPAAQISPQPIRPPPSPPPKLPAKRVIFAEEEIITRNEKVFTWADKYRPEALKDFICNRNKALELQAMLQEKADDCDHFIFEGPPGVGKKTMIWALLREAFGPDRVQAREETKQFVFKGEAVGSIEVTVKISSQHVEVNLSEVKGYEKQVIVELIKETTKKLSQKGLQCTRFNCRVIILNEADNLSTDALLYIKWQLERYRGCNKVFFCCRDVSKLQPVKSLCTVVPLLPPSNDEIVEVLKFIAKEERIELPNQLAANIADNSNNNLRQAIRSLEATWQSNSRLEEDQEVLTGWEDDIVNIGKDIIEEQSPKQ